MQLTLARARSQRVARRTSSRLRRISSRFRPPALLIALAVVLLAACAPESLPPETLTATATAPSPTAAVSTARPPTPSLAALTPATPARRPVTLTWWTPDFLSPQAAPQVKALLEAQLADFERTYAGQVQVDVVPKMPYGKGGLLDLLRTAQPVAPSILPDLVALDVFELEQAVSSGLLQPLDASLAQEALEPLYPFARSAGMFQNQLFAVQYLADLEHIVFLSNIISEPPQTWDDLLRSSATPYLFPAGVPQPGKTTSRFRTLQCVELSHYLSAGAALNRSTRQLALEETPLLRLLTFYKTAADAGLLPPNAVEINSTDVVWDLFVQGRIPLAQVTARQYLTEGRSAGAAGFAATPGWNGPATPIAAGWALAIVATDPQRQQLAADLIAWLLEAERGGAVARATGWLPTSPAALATWGEQTYYAFLDQQLSKAVSPPAGPEYAQASAQLHKAVIAVLSDGISPRDATNAALSATRQ